MDNPNRRADDKRAPGQLQWGESGEAAAPVKSFKQAFHAATNSGEGYDDAIAAGLRAAAASAPTKMTDDDITVIWQTMPGGPAGWLKSFGFLQFARAVEEQVLENNVSPAASASADNPSTAGAAKPYAYEESDGNTSELVFAQWFDGGYGKMDECKTYTPLFLAAPVAQSTAGAARRFGKVDVLDAWACIRKNNSSIADDALDDMREVLLESLAAPAAQATASLDLTKLHALVDAARVCTSVTSMREIVECIGALGEKGGDK